MKTLKFLALIVASAMFLAACNTGGGGGNGGPTTGTLTVNVSPVAGTIVVKDAADAVVDTRTGTTYTWTDMEPGTYSIEVQAPTGYLDSGAVATVVAGGTAVANITLAPSSSVSGNVGNVEIVGFVDDAGDPYDWMLEDNEHAAKVLVAAQTEEMVGVQILVTDELGDPIANAPVTVSVTNDFTSALAIYPGYPIDVTASAAQTFQGVTTNADGYAYFTVEATNSSISWQELLNTFFGGGLMREPVKLIVSAVGGNNVAKRAEFKAFFANMSHLYYGDDDGNFIYTDARLGADLGTIINIWDNRSGADNAHYFGTYAFTKQPQYGPFPVPLFLPDPETGGLFPGSVSYTIVEGGENVDWGLCGAVPNGVQQSAIVVNPGVISSDGLTCTVYADDEYGMIPIGISETFTGEMLSLVPDVNLEDLPISVTVEVVYNFGVWYGEEYYEFALKSYTFTKDWVGGFLGVDKFVDQHVLTWAGEAVTLAPASVTYEEVFTSKVHVVISNPSDSTMYNVSVRDVVPAELGVVTGSISDGGTYDPFNHAVTWNNVLELQELAPGAEPIVLTFDVYARHKPGYCWTPGAERGDVPPLWPEPGTAEPCDPYDDPYLVVNGAQYQDFSGNSLLGVSAAAQFADDETLPQVVFYYEPVADESDIWVVRPLLAIDKQLVSPDVMDVGATAIFEISVRQIDRVSTVVDPGNTEYAFLFDRYPWEFAVGGLLDGVLPGNVPSHVAISPVVIDEQDVVIDGSDSEPFRDNPYARNIAVTDAFDYGLDFTSGIDFNGSLIVPGSTKVVGKTVTFDAIPFLSRLDPQYAIIRLTGQLPSDDLTAVPLGNSQNGAIAQLTADGLYAWQNCAYLFGPQLNQPYYNAVSNPIFDTLVYPLPRYVGGLWAPYFQIDGEYWFGTDLVPNATDVAYVPNGTNPWPINASGRIEWCDEVAVVPLPPAPVLGINVDGEHFDVTFAGGLLELDNRTDVFYIGETFYYVYSVENSGLGTALNVEVEIDRTNLRTGFIGAPVVYTTASPRPAAGPIPATLETEGVFYDLTVNTAGSKHLLIPSMNPGQIALIVIEASANQVGGQIITHQVPAYDNPPAYQDFSLLVSTDSTTVAPGTRPAPPVGP